MDSLPVDIRGVLAAAEAEDQPWGGFPAGTMIGHMHLQVGDIPTAARFYSEVLGFDIVAQMPSALFVSAGGYHHHIGMNTWHSRGAKPAPAGSAGLRHFTIEFADEPARLAVLERLTADGNAIEWDDHVAVVQDPWQNTLRLRIRE
jgi:catechol 2,3-dioxygenase